MKFGKLIQFSFRSIFRNRMRSLLTSLGIIIGVGSVIVMVGIGEGSQVQVKQQIASMGTNLLMVMPPRGARDANRLSREDVAKIRAEASYVKAISGQTGGSFEIIGGSGEWSTSVRGVEPDYLIINNRSVAKGDFFTEEDLAASSKVAVVGSTVAAKLFESRNPIGQQVRIGTMPCTIIGVLDTKGSNSSGADQDDIVLVPLDTALAHLSRDQYLSAIQISVVREDLMDAAQKEIDSILRESHRLSATATADFDIMNQSAIIKTASQTTQTLTALLAAIAGVSLVVGGIGIMNIMLVSVTERTREIGIRMSVGARKKDILFQFLSESVILSLIGGGIGILLAVGICAALTKFLGMMTVIDPMVILASVGFSAAVGIFFGYYPAKKAAGLYPIDALRYE